MLQQTRVSAVIPYFERFVARFPDYASLAQAPEADLLAHWAGLGYYYRARNLQKAAVQMVAAGGFPSTHEGIEELPGIGPYTAAAVASIAFDLPHAVVDGNVYRVLSRAFNDGTNIASSQARRHFTVMAESLLDRQSPGAFNQAVMELGATICLPKRPQCLLCPVRAFCEARRLGVQDTLPVKLKTQKNVDETRQVLMLQHEETMLLWQRPAESRLMPGFWELPEPVHLPAAVLHRQIGTFRHGITIHNYTFEVWEAELAVSEMLPAHFQWVDEGQLAALPLSTIVRKALRIGGRSVNRATAAAV